MGAFTEKEWADVYKRAYENLAPEGGLSRLNQTSSRFSHVFFPQQMNTCRLTLYTGHTVTTELYPVILYGVDGAICSSS